MIRNSLGDIKFNVVGNCAHFAVLIWVALVACIIVFFVYCLVAIFEALQNYGESYCKQTNIPVYVVICTFLTFAHGNYKSVDSVQTNGFSRTVNVNYGSHTVTTVWIIDILLPFWQAVINGCLFAWGHYEYQTVSCSNKLNNLLIYKIGFVFYICSVVMLVLNFIFIFLREEKFLKKTVTTVQHTQETDVVTLSSV